MYNFRNVLWGLVLITLGVIIGLNSLEITNINIFFDGWWTLFIIVPCFIDLFKEENKTGNLIGLTIGLLLLLICQDYLDFDIVYKLFFPFILVIIGISCIFKNTFSKKAKKISQINKSEKEVCATFSGHEIDYKNEKFDGCKLSAIFGGIECDLREAIIDEDVVIEATCIFGGLDIYAPKDVNVVVNSTSVFGGVDNKTKNKEGNKTIYINATCIFGGIDVK